MMTRKWDEWVAETAQREAARQARPWAVKAADSAYWRVRRAWNDTLNPRHVRNTVRWFIQRGCRGWSDADAWSVDSYITKVLGEMIGHLADHTMSWPGESDKFQTPEDWEAYLRDLSRRLLQWNTETFLSSESFERSKDAVEETLRLLMSEWGGLWD